MKNIKIENFSTKSMDIQSRLALQKFWKESSPLAAYVPYIMPNGFKFMGFVGYCSACQKSIEKNNLRGVFRAVLPHVHEFRGYGHCNPCHIMTPFLFRLREVQNGIVKFEQDSSGSWQAEEFGNYKKNWLEKILAVIL